jgi:hypothetical protein
MVAVMDIQKEREALIAEIERLDRKEPKADAEV